MLGRSLRDDEGFTIHPSHLLQEAPTGVARELAYKDYRADLDRLSARAANFSEQELDAAMDAAW